MKRPIALLCLLFALTSPIAHAELPDAARFSAALELGDVAQARAWLDEGLDPNFEGTLIGTGLMIGAWEGNIALMELFLERGADIHRVNRHGETALMLAAWKNRGAAMRWLIERGARPNRGGAETRAWTALHYASFAGHAELVDDLLTAGADVNARSTNGSTVVMMAAREGHAGIAKRLLDAGANPAIKNEQNDDAVAWAMRQGHYDIAKTFTSAENFAALARAAAAQAQPRPLRSVPVPDAVDEQLRMARLAEAKGRRGDALDAYRKALALLKAQQEPRKLGAGATAKPAKAAAAGAPNALVISAKRAQPERQTMGFVPTGGAEANADQLLEQARAADAAGRRADAIRLYRQAAVRIKAGGER